MLRKLLLIFFRFLTLGPGSALALSLQDPPYQFEALKLSEAQTSFQFYRSFVDYFYLVTAANQKNLQILSKLQSTSGWCVGDAHPENFGVLILQNRSALFTMNDMDDAGPCPVVLDLFRLLIGSQLSNDRIHGDSIIDGYISGLRGDMKKFPAEVNDLMAKSAKKGLAPNPGKVKGKSLVRELGMRELSALELTQIKNLLLSLDPVISPKVELLDAIATMKLGGGSGGLLRYEVLINNFNQRVHLEFKEQVIPAIYPVATSPLPVLAERISKSIQILQGVNASSYYQRIKLPDREMLMRPRFYGNSNIKFEKKADQDAQELVAFEAYILGKIHGRSVNNVSEYLRMIEAMPRKQFFNEVQLMVHHFNEKYSSLKVR